MTRRRLGRLLWPSLLLTTTVGCVDTAFGQAYLPERGEVSFSMAYTRFEGGDHLYDQDVSYLTQGYVCEGRSCFLGTEQSNTMLAGFDAGLHRRVALSGSVAYVGSRYTGTAPINLNIDDGLWRGGFQDAYVQLRVRALERPLTVTPHVGFRFPLREYPAQGHAAPGRHRQAWSMGLSLARALPGMPRGFFEFRYSFVTDDLPIDLYRNFLDLSLGYHVTRKLAVSVSSGLLSSTGGLSWSGGDGCGHACPPDSGNPTAQESELGTAASNSRFLRLGGGVTYHLGRFAIFASASTTLHGENTIEADFFTLGATVTFKTPWAPKSLW